jgi:hypothetical protein
MIKELFILKDIYKYSDEIIYRLAGPANFVTALIKKSFTEFGNMMKYIQLN